MKTLVTTYKSLEVRDTSTWDWANDCKAPFSKSSSGGRPRVYSGAAELSCTFSLSPFPCSGQQRHHASPTAPEQWVSVPQAGRAAPVSRASHFQLQAHAHPGHSCSLCDAVPCIPNPAIPPSLPPFLFAKAAISEINLAGLEIYPQLTSSLALQDVTKPTILRTCMVFCDVSLIFLLPLATSTHKNNDET